MKIGIHHIFGFIMAVSCAAHASASEKPDSMSATLDEVSVTAIKAVGASGAALSGVSSTRLGAAEVERFNVVTMKNVSEIAPNFYVPDYGSRMTSSIYVRGIGARIDQPVVGLNVDNVPYLNKDNYDFDLFDIESVEVVRGPQSTLYGRNTMGGVVNITTLSPLRYRGLRFMVGAATGNGYRAAASAYFGVSRHVAMGVSLYGSYSGGFFRNSYNGVHADREEGVSARWKTSWRPAAGVTLENTASLSVSRQHGYPYAWVETGRIAYNDTCFYRRMGFTDGLTVSYRNPAGVSVSSITSVQYIDDNMTLDQDFLTLDYFTLTQKRREWAVTQDFIAKGSTGRYSWLAGLFGFWKDTSMSAPVTFKEDGIDGLIVSHRNDSNPYYPIAWNGDRLLLDSDFEPLSRGAALYHRSAFDFGKLNVAVDLRLDHEAVSLDYRSGCSSSYTLYNNTLGGAPVVDRIVDVDIDMPGHLSKSFTQVLPKLTVGYDAVADGIASVYLSVAKGYKAGGYNTQMFSDVLRQRLMETMGVTAKYDVDRIVSYNPEKSWNYELGARLSTRDRRLAGEMAVFYIDCRDQQLTTFPDGTTTGRIMANAGRTRSVGFELSARWRPLEWLVARISYGYTSARFADFDDGRNDYSGRRVPYAPSNTLFAGVTARRDVGHGLEIEGNLDLRGIGNIYWDEINQYSQPFYLQLGASLTIRSALWSVELWGENLTDTRFDTFSYVSVSNRFMQRGKPVRGGVTFRINLARE